MGKIRWSEKASSHLQAIHEYISKEDVATIVEHHAAQDGGDGYSLEVFNALGETIGVVTVSESEIAPLTEKEILSVRRLAV